MAKKTSLSIKQVLRLAPGSHVEIKGWVRTRRDSKAGFSFINVSDGSTFDPIQVVADQTLENYTSQILKLTTACAIVCHGKLTDSGAANQKLEIQADRIDVLGWVDDPEHYPIQPKPHSFEFLREVAHLRPRTNAFSAITRVRHATMQAVHAYFNEQGYYWVNTPIITTSDAEGAGDLFRVSTLDLLNLPMIKNAENQAEVDFSQDFFSQEAFLTVSGQLNVEAYCLALSKVYTFGPTFRAENSNTSRHLAEFWMIEPEIAFANLDDLADLAESFLQYIFAYVLENCREDMEFFAKRIEPSAISRLEKMLDKDFKRVDYGEAVSILEKANKKFEFPVEWGLDLQTEHERYLSEVHFKSPVIVMNYPTEIKAFYMRLNEGGKTVAALDVLAPGVGEIIGGSQREERYDVLKRRMIAHGLDTEVYDWYLDLRRYGTVEHAGFGLGFERLVSYITGMNNIRDVIPFPRVPGNAGF